MTVTHYIWVIAENCHWPVNDSFALQLGNRRNCHWPVNDSLEEVFKNCYGLVNDSFALQLGNRRKLSLTGQWQSWTSLLKMSLTSQWQFSVGTHSLKRKNCHWPVNDNFVKVHIPTWCRPFQNCHWPVNDIFRRLFQNCHWPVNDNFLW